MRMIFLLAALAMGCVDASSGGGGAGGEPAQGAAGGGGSNEGGDAQGGAGGSISTTGGGGQGEGGAPTCAAQAAPGGIPVTAATPGEPQLLATGQDDFWGFAMDDDYLYWVNGVMPAQVARLPKDGSGELEVLAEGLIDPGQPALSDGFLYYGDADGTVNRVSVAGGCVEVLATGQDGPWAVAVDDTDVYFGDFYAGTIKKVPKSGGTVTDLASGQDGTSEILLDATHVYWLNKAGNVQDAGSVRRVAKSGGTVDTLAAPVTIPVNLRWYEGDVFFVDLALQDVAVAKLVPPGGGVVTELYSMQHGTDAAIVGGSVFFGAVLPNTLSQWEPTNGATLLVTLPERPFYVETDESFIYWVHRDVGEVMRMLKP